ncbi:hypothetical protein L218DRAFT_1081076 [Marasmius fiardii PR-910]|nr:hypothetical protein L218DRAFT_1081076 [Marasmius fiardii PR-910]
MSTIIKDADINELNDELIKSFEADHSHVDLDALFHRSFCYSFCGAEEYSLPWLSAEDFPTALSGFLDDVKNVDNVLENPRKRKLGEDHWEDESFHHARTRTSNSNGLLPSFNCFSNMDLRARRVFQAYRNEHSTQAINRDKSFNAHSRRQTEPVGTHLKTDVNDEEGFSPCIARYKSKSKVQNTPEITALKIDRRHTTKPIPIKAGLAARNMNVVDLLTSCTHPLLSNNTSVPLPLDDTDCQAYSDSGIQFLPILPDFSLAHLGSSGSHSTAFEDFFMPTESPMMVASTSSTTSTLKKSPSRHRRARTATGTAPFSVLSFAVDPPGLSKVASESHASLSSFTSSVSSEEDIRVAGSHSEDEQDLASSSPLARFSKRPKSICFAV